MANDYIALADMVVLNDLNATDVGVNDILDDSPFLQVAAAAASSNGHLHKYIKDTANPTVGFRAANAGREHDSTTSSVVTETLTILDASFKVDKAVADSYERGGAMALMAREARRHLRAAFFKYEQQVFQGTNADAAGFNGFEDATTLDALADTMVIAGGATGAETDTSSVWAVRTNDMGTDFQLIMADGGRIELGEVQVIEAKEAGADQWFPAYFVPVTAYVGIQMGSIYSVGRLANLDDGGTNVCTDAKLATLLEVFPAGRKPNYLCMSRRSQRQLQASRTATNPTGSPAPFPTESFGIPIVVTDAIPDNDVAIT